MNVLVVIDAQNDYIDGALANEKSKSILPLIKKRIEKARSSGEVVFFTRDTHGANYLQTQEGRRFPTLHGMVDSNGWKLIDGLFAEGDNLIEKPTFASVRLAAVLGKINPEKITLIGYGAHTGVISSAIILRNALHESRIVVESSLCASDCDESLEIALKAMANCQIDIL